MKCPQCTFTGTDAEVDEHRATGVHNDLPQAGSNLRSSLELAAIDAISAHEEAAGYEGGNSMVKRGLEVQANIAFERLTKEVHAASDNLPELVEKAERYAHKHGLLYTWRDEYARARKDHNVKASVQIALRRVGLSYTDLIRQPS